MSATADDGVQHLMWRLRHGEGIASDGPQIAVIMTGSADLTYASFKVGCTINCFDATMIGIKSKYASCLHQCSVALCAIVCPSRLKSWLDWKAKQHNG